jgi:hypothetical protein
MTSEVEEKLREVYNEKCFFNKENLNKETKTEQVETTNSE